MKQDIVGRRGPYCGPEFAPDYALCRYGLSRMSYRGPARPLDGRYIAFLGGTETFGKFLDLPFPARVEERLGEVCVNFGAVNAGIDVHARDDAVLAAAHDALATVIQVPGVQNQSNRFYAVHPRRNDRFLRPTAALETLYPDIDFADIVFTRHLLYALQDRCAERFNLLRAELQDQWVARMRALLGRIAGPKLLLWFADHAPALTVADQDILHTDPLFVTAGMIDEARGEDAALCVVVPEVQEPGLRVAGMKFHPVERPVAEAMLGSAAHDLVAETVARSLAPILA